MPISINGTGSIDGISVGGYPTGTVNTTSIAASAVTPVKISQPFTEMGAVSVSTTSVAFTSIPSWVRRITIAFNAVSVSGTASQFIQLGSSSGYTTTGYVSSLISPTGVSGGTGGSNSTAGLLYFVSATAAQGATGHMILTNVGSNIWVASSVCNFDGFVSTSAIASCAGRVTLPATLDRLRLYTSNGTDTFDAGSVNVFYE